MGLRAGRCGLKSDTDAVFIAPDDFASAGYQFSLFLERDCQGNFLSRLRFFAALNEHAAAAHIPDDPADSVVLVLNERGNGARFTRVSTKIGAASSGSALRCPCLNLDSISIVIQRIFQEFSPLDHRTIEFIDAWLGDEGRIRDPDVDFSSRNEIKIRFEVKALLAVVDHPGLMHNTPFKILEGDQSSVIEPGIGSFFCLFHGPNSKDIHHKFFSSSGSRTFSEDP